jgi:hypothetical protein
MLVTGQSSKLLARTLSFCERQTGWCTLENNSSHVQCAEWLRYSVRFPVEALNSQREHHWDKERLRFPLRVIGGSRSHDHTVYAYTLLRSAAVLLILDRHSLAYQYPAASSSSIPLKAHVYKHCICPNKPWKSNNQEATKSYPDSDLPTTYIHNLPSYLSSSSHFSPSDHTTQNPFPHPQPEPQPQCSGANPPRSRYPAKTSHPSKNHTCAS